MRFSITTIYFAIIAILSLQLTNCDVEESREIKSSERTYSVTETIYSDDCDCSHSHHSDCTTPDDCKGDDEECCDICKDGLGGCSGIPVIRV